MFVQPDPTYHNQTESKRKRPQTNTLCLYIVQTSSSGSSAHQRAHSLIHRHPQPTWPLHKKRTFTRKGTEWDYIDEIEWSKISQMSHREVIETKTRSISRFSNPQAHFTSRSAPSPSFVVLSSNRCGSKVQSYSSSLGSINKCTRN